MRDGRIGLALARQFDWIVGESVIGDALPSTTAITRLWLAGANGRPIEGLTKAWAKQAEVS